MVNLQYSTYNRSLLPLLETNGLHVIKKHEMLNEKEAAFVDSYFELNVYPVLTPMAVDSSRPFPLIRNKSLNLGALVTKKTVTENWNLPRCRYPAYCPVLWSCRRMRAQER